MGIMDGLVNTGTTLLEPLISFKISATEDLLGAITSDITQMRGTFESPEMENGKFILTGILPVAKGVGIFTSIFRLRILEPSKLSGSSIKG